MFNKTFNITILNSQWSPIKTGLKMGIVPRKGEFILIDEKYYEVINIVHTITSKSGYFVIINDLDEKKNKKSLTF